MAKTEHYFTKFENGLFYHVYNRTVDRQTMFRNAGNYDFFLRKFDLYLSPISEIYTYCLLGNHFHFLIRIIDDFAPVRFTLNLVGKHSTHSIVSHQFRKFFQSYAMAFNKQHNRIGTLFQTPFKRACVNSENYLKYLIYYIHSNPQHHEIIKDFRNWEWSSYNKIISNEPGKLKKAAIIELFGSENKFRDYHTEKQVGALNSKIILEDE